MNNLEGKKWGKISEDEKIELTSFCDFQEVNGKWFLVVLKEGNDDIPFPLYKINIPNKPWFMMDYKEYCEEYENDEMIMDEIAFDNESNQEDNIIDVIESISSDAIIEKY